MAARYETVIGPLMRGSRETGLRLFPPRPGMRVLDVGCGAGAQLSSYAAADCVVTGLDTSPAMLAEARGRLGPRAGLVRGDAAALPFPDGSFDLVMAATVLHQLPEEVVPAALGEMARVVDDAGRVLVLDYHPAMRIGLRSKVMGALGTAIETLAGTEHRRCYRAFLESGGLPALAHRGGLEIEHQDIGAAGTFGVYLLRTVGEPSRSE